MECKFEKAWIGKCASEVIEGSDFCKDHDGMKCCSCGQSATHDCYETGQFVCGAPLCDDCEHTTSEDGTNGGIGFNAQPSPKGMKTHCRKSEQKYDPWYMQDKASPKESKES